jgi:hypothetical protein
MRRQAAGKPRIPRCAGLQDAVSPCPLPRAHRCPLQAGAKRDRAGSASRDRGHGESASASSGPGSRSDHVTSCREAHRGKHLRVASRTGRAGRLAGFSLGETRRLGGSRAILLSVERTAVSPPEARPAPAQIDPLRRLSLRRPQPQGGRLIAVLVSQAVSLARSCRRLASSEPLYGARQAPLLRSPA